MCVVIVVLVKKKGSKKWTLHAMLGCEDRVERDREYSVCVCVERGRCGEAAANKSRKHSTKRSTNFYTVVEAC